MKLPLHALTSPTATSAIAPVTSIKPCSHQVPPFLLSPSLISKLLAFDKLQTNMLFRNMAMKAAIPLPFTRTCVRTLD